MKIINPADGSTIKELTESSPAQMDECFKLLLAGAKKWRREEVSQRVLIIQKFSDLLNENKDSLAMTLSLETGKPLFEAMNEISGACGKIEFFTRESTELLAAKTVADDGVTKEIISYDPLGVIANISAWNYPYLVGINIFIPALIAGNAVFYKPSEYATLTGLEIERLLIVAGVPADVFKAVIGGREVGEYLCELPLNGYFFTGSYQTGVSIAKKIASKLVPVIFELGGKDPLYVTDDIADIEASAASVVEGAFYNNGQSCCSVERIYVHQDIYEKFIAALKVSVSALKVGHPQATGITQGCITRAAHVEFLQQQLADALKKGARQLNEPTGHPAEGAYFSPLILIDVDHSMTVMQEETFGPLVGVMPVESDAMAISLMNDTPYGLTAAVFAQDIARASSILSEVNSGSSYINCCDRVSGNLPWSGRGFSGLGTSLSFLGLYAFVSPRGLHVRK